MKRSNKAASARKSSARCSKKLFTISIARSFVSPRPLPRCPPDRPWKDSFCRTKSGSSKLATGHWRQARFIDEISASHNSQEPDAAELCGQLFYFSRLALDFHISGTAAQNVEDLLDKINRLPASERQQRLADGARKEGELVWYSTMNRENSQELINLFRKNILMFK